MKNTLQISAGLVSRDTLYQALRAGACRGGDRLVVVTATDEKDNPNREGGQTNPEDRAQR